MSKLTVQPMSSRIPITLVERYKGYGLRLRNYLQSRTLISIVSSRNFFIFTLVFFVLQASWMAFSSNINVPHDESYHMNHIQRYSQQLSPFIDTQGQDDARLGDITRNTSYLYAYFMSFPYRVISKLSSNLIFQLIAMRLINVGLSAISLVLFKKILEGFFKSKGLANIAVFMTSLTTVFVFTSAGVSYENLFVLLFAVALYYSNRYVNSKNLFDLLMFASSSFLGSITKYAFLTLIPGIIVFMLVAAYCNGGRKELKILFRPQFDIGSVRRKVVLLLSCAFLVISGYLFAERYVVNVVRYGSPVPDCSSVQTVESCKQWPPYGRNLRRLSDISERKVVSRYSVTGYLVTWYEVMKEGAMGIYTTGNRASETFLLSLATPVMIATTIAGFVIGYKKTNVRKVLIILIPSLIYVLVLLIKNYTEVKQYYALIATQARYIMVVLPFFYVATAAIISGNIAGRRLKNMVLFSVLIVFCSGGLVSYVQLTTPQWLLPYQSVQIMNLTAKELLRPINFLVIKR